MNITLFGSETCDLLSLADASNKLNISKQTSIGGVGNTQVEVATLN